VGWDALHELVSMGDDGEAALFARPLGFPETIQVRRRWLKYVASRQDTVTPRLIERLRMQTRYQDSHAASYLFAGTSAAKVQDSLYPLLGVDLADYGASASRFVAWGRAGCDTGALWELVHKSHFKWEKLATSAFRAGCASLARAGPTRLWPLEQLTTSYWDGDGFKLLSVGDNPDEAVSNEAIAPSELQLAATGDFVSWRRGEIADEILREWSAHSHWRLRQFGAMILRGLAFQRTQASLITWLQREPVERTRTALIGALEHSASRVGADAILEHFERTKEGSRALARIGWRTEHKERALSALDRIVEAERTYRGEALVSMARMGERHSRVSELLTSTDHYERLTAALALAYLNDEKAIPMIDSLRQEAARPLETVFLNIALAILGDRAAGLRLNAELSAAATVDDSRNLVDVFFLDGFLQEALLSGLKASAGASTPRALEAWTAELRPLELNASPISPASSAPMQQRTEKINSSTALPGTVRIVTVESGAHENTGPPRAKRPRLSKSIRSADVLVLTVNPHETRALLEVFAEMTGTPARPVSIDDRLYRTLGTLNNTSFVHALSEMGSGGAGAAQETVYKAIRAIRPRAIISLGLAFGINPQKQAIGDILVSKQLRLYDLQRLGNEVIPRGDKSHASSWLINFFEGVAQTSWTGATVRFGVILTGDKLVDNTQFRDQLTKFEPEAIGGEMEGAGLYVASHDQKVDWIVIKAICDWADGEKDKDKDPNQRIAAANAAQFLVHAAQHASLKRKRIVTR
jgi:nucleoside phosphorylase